MTAFGESQSSARRRCGSSGAEEPTRSKQSVAHPDRADLVLVRARVREDLESLSELTGPLEIVHTPRPDYAFRAEMSRERWSATLIQLAAETDYPNFKDAVRRDPGLRPDHGRPPGVVRALGVAALSGQGVRQGGIYFFP